MKTGLLVGLGLGLGIPAVLVMAGIGKYNTITKLDEAADQYHSNVQTALQRRGDLINNLAEIAKGYASHEQKTLIETAQARAGGLGKQGTAKTEDAAKALKEHEAAASVATQQALMAFNQVREAYPDLKANQQFNKLMDELARTENQIRITRNLENKVVRAYNQSIRLFPGSIIANMAGFDKKDYFEAEAGSAKAPQLKF